MSRPVRLDAIPLDWLTLGLNETKQLALEHPRETQWAVIREAKIQVGLKHLPGELLPWRIYLRRPGGEERSGEALAVARGLDLEPTEPERIRGRISRGGYLGPRAYLMTRAKEGS